METEIYTAAWDQAKPKMMIVMASIATALLHHGLAMGEINESGDEEFCLSAGVLKDGEAIGYMSFTLHDGDVHGEEGFGVSLTWEGSQGELTAHRWSPYAYTEISFVLDIAEILRRIDEDLDVTTAVDFAVTDLLGLAEPE